MLKNARTHMTLINGAFFKPIHCLFNLSRSSKIITKITWQFCSLFYYSSFNLKSFSFRITSNYFKSSCFSNHHHFTYSWASSVWNHSLWAWLQSYREGHSVEWYAHPALVSSPALPMNQGPREESLVVLASHMHFAGYADTHSILENTPASAKHRLI